MTLTSQVVILLSATARPFRAVALFHCKNSTIRHAWAEGAISIFDYFQRCADSQALLRCRRTASAPERPPACRNSRHTSGQSAGRRSISADVLPPIL